MPNFEQLPTLARRAILASFSQDQESFQVDSSDLPALGAFVTLWKNGELRGCIGHLEPIHDSVDREVWDCAVLAASKDPRFAPVSHEEMPAITIEVSLVLPYEPISDRSQLDPIHYGVIVEQDQRRGTLLPDIEGITTPDLQVQCAAEKAAIDLAKPHQLYRYKVHKVCESEDDNEQK